MTKPIKKAVKSGRSKVAVTRERCETEENRGPVPPADFTPPERKPNSDLEGSNQRLTFDRAVNAFQQGNFAEARSLFEKASNGSHIQMAHVARQHIRMCDQRLSANPPPLTTAEEKYDYGLALLNRRDLEPAETWLQQALEGASGQGAEADHVHYALALLYGFRGEMDRAAEHLRRAIQIQPRNRLAARNDPDFAELSRRNAIREILFPDRNCADS